MKDLWCRNSSHISSLFLGKYSPQVLWRYIKSLRTWGLNRAFMIHKSFIVESYKRNAFFSFSSEGYCNRNILMIASNIQHFSILHFKSKLSVHIVLNKKLSSQHSCSSLKNAKIFPLCYILTNKHNIQINEDFKFCIKHYSILPLDINLDIVNLQNVHLIS